MGGQESLVQQSSRNRVQDDMKDMISIIVPVYNGEAFIKECVDSIVKQTISNLEIILVDDGSIDGTLDILCSLAVDDNRIKIIHQDNGGVSKARNRGIDEAQGEWIVFVDADDVIQPDYCESLLETAKQMNSDVLIAGALDEEGAKIISDQIPRLVHACLSFNETDYSYNIDAPWGKIFRTSLIKNQQIRFPEKLVRSEDAFFCMNAYLKAKVVAVLNKMGYCHVEREGSLCRSYTERAPEILNQVLLENYTWMEANELNEEYYRQGLWYRVLPGIVECENTYFLHPDNTQSVFKKMLRYQRMLSQKMVKAAIKKLRLNSVAQRQYKARLLLYKLHFGWAFFLGKAAGKCHR